MKNLVISIITSMMLCNADFWMFESLTQKAVVTLAYAAVIWWMQWEVEEFIYQNRMRRWRTKRIIRNLHEAQNRP